jgi:hypothetical protein
MSKAFQPIRQTIKKPGRQLGRRLRLVRQAGEATPEPARDVWQWTQRKYRVRAILLLLVNAALFAGLGCFTFWLRTGEHTPFSGQPYWQMWSEAFNPTGDQQKTLIDFLLYPIPVDQVPLMLVIVGLVLASLTSIPILISMLYGFSYSLLFTAIVGFVAVLPWLAISVTFCCLLARWRRLQFSFRLATGLISLLPLVAYYALATRNVSASFHLAPLEMAKLYVPWVLALTGACVVMALVLLMAKLVNYRPGAIAPFLTVMFAIPVVLFEAKVGRDELYYRLLQNDFGPNSQTHFVDELDAAELIQRVAESRLGSDESIASLLSVAEQMQVTLTVRLAAKQHPQDEIASLINEDFAMQQHEAVQACQRFRNRFPRSRYIPNALYLQGQALDTRIDREVELLGGTLIVRHYQDFPNAASKPAWRELYEHFATSPLASVAGYRLAILEARAGHVDEAIKLLDELIARFGQPKTEQVPATRANVWASILSKRPASSALAVDPETIAIEGRKLRNLLAENRDPQQNDLPLQKLLSFDPHHPFYHKNLEHFLQKVPEKYPLTPLRDNLQVLIAKSQPARSFRIEHLRACIDQLAGVAGSDALPRARFELGLAYQDDHRQEEARVAFEQVKLHHADSPWAIEASRRLAAMGAAGSS